MMHQTDVEQLTLAGLAHCCAQETDLFFQREPNDPRYCYELVRRAIKERDERARELVYAQYGPQVARWVERHTAFASSGEEVQYVVNRAFEKMWLAPTPEKSGVSAEELAPEVGVDGPGVEDQVLDHVLRQAFWQKIEARLQSEKERRVIYGSFALALKPREIYAQSGELFDDVKEVYRIKENVLARLRRDSELRKLPDVDV